jgi:uncharacterized membrane protein (UPF0182 family)
LAFRKNKIKKDDSELEYSRSGARIATIILLVVLAALIIFGLATFLTDFLWFKEIGYTGVFWKNVLVKVLSGIPIFLLVTFVVRFYLSKLKSNYYRKVLGLEPDKENVTNVGAWVLSGIFGLFISIVSVSKLWFEGLQFISSAMVGKADPLFNLDASFCLFKLKFIADLDVIVGVALLLLILLTIFYHLLLMSTKPPEAAEIAAEKEAQEEAREEEEDEEEDDYYNFNRNFNRQGYNRGAGHKDANDYLQKIPFLRKKKKPDPEEKKQSRINLDRIDRKNSGRNLKEVWIMGNKAISIIIAVFFVVVAVWFITKQFDLLHSDTGTVYGAAYRDVHITLWMYRLLTLISLAAAVIVPMGIMKKKLRTIIMVPVVMLGVAVVGFATGAIVQNFVVSPDEISKESKYMERNIDFTQYAYNLANVKKVKFAAENKLESDELSQNDVTLSNVRINDYKPTQTFYNQTQSIRQYYDFNDVDVDRYVTNGEYTQTFLATREIDESKISDTWVNRHLKYTHGYGVTLSRVDKITDSGQPDVLIGGVPPVSKAKEIEIKRPEVYFGELTNDYVIVNSDEDEFDYPDGDENAYTRYKGDAGIKLNFISRLAFAAKERSIKLLVSSNVNGDSRIVINRNIKNRVEKILPNLQYDDPYMCTVNGKLYWIIDAYTTSSRFPYSQPYDVQSPTNYIRNSVKVVVDAYNGDTDYYIVDDTDAIAATYAKIYPSLFKSADKMPEGIRAHIRYPSQMLNIQAKIYEKYHVNDVKVFYQKEDLWQISNEIYGTKEQEMVPNYYIMKIPGETEEEFVNTIPFTPKDKKNMTGLLLARNDGENYGQMMLYQLPKSRVVYGPMQVEAMIDQSTEISKEFSLWDSSGSKYSRGNMFIIPIEDSLLYVEPVYLEATNSSIPEVKRVIVVYGDKIAYEPTLSEALESLFGDGAGGAASINTGSGKSTSGGDKGKSQSEIIEDAQEAYDNAQDAVKEGNWKSYGKYMDQLEKDLNKLR